MLKLLKKFVLSFFAALIILFSVAPSFSIHAQVYNPTWYAQGPADYWGKVYDLSNPSEIFGERYTAAQVQWVFYSVIMFGPTMLFGPKFPSLVACVFNIASGQVNMDQCISTFTAGIPEVKPVARTTAPQPRQTLFQAIFADRPMSGISYVRNKVDNFSIVKPARAQTIGFGFDALLPIQAMWSGVRNIAFSFFVVIAVVFAFLVMFRVKLSPQTVVTVQSALPKIVMAIITVTFSYAIAGFLIDFMYVVIGLVSVAASQIFSFAFGPIALGPVQYFNFLTLGQPINVTIPVIGTVNPQIGVFGLLIMYITFFLFAFGLVLVFNLGIVGTGIAALLAGAIAIFAPMVAVVFILLVLVLIVVAVIVAIVQSIKVCWTLLKAFVNIVLLTIFAPVQLTLGILIPNFGFGAWVRSYISALSTFVVTGVLILFSYVFLLWGIQAAAQTFAANALNQIFQAFVVALGGSPSIGSGFLFGQNGWPPLLGVGGGWVGLLLLGVSFVIYTTIPKSAEMVQAFLQGKPFAYGNAIGEALGPVRWAAGTAWNQTGARDTWEIAQLARKYRIMNQIIGDSGPLRPYAERFIGGSSDEVNTAIDNALGRHRKTIGKTA